MTLPYPYGLTQDEVDAAYGDVRLAAERKFAAIEDDLRKPLSREQKQQAWKQLFMEQVNEHQANLKIWMDGDGKLWLGWYRKDGHGITWIIIRALVQTKSQTIVAVPMRRHLTDAVDGVAWERPWMAQQVWEKLRPYRIIVPPGVF